MRNQDNETESSSMRGTQENLHEFLRSYSSEKVTSTSRQEEADILEHDRLMTSPVNRGSSSISPSETLCNNALEPPVASTRLLTASLGYSGFYAGKGDTIGQSEIHRSSSTDKDSRHDFPTYLESAPMVYGDLENIVMTTHPKLLPQASIIRVSIEKLIQNLQNKLKDQYPTKYKLEKKLLLVFKGRDFNDTNLCSIDDFRHCMKLLNITLSEVELNTICAEYTDSLDDDNLISYLQFISVISQNNEQLSTESYF
jgi:hypothetical protein